MSTVWSLTGLRERLAARRAEQARIEARAEAQVEADEAALASPRPNAVRLTLAGAAREFWHHPSPWIMVTTLVAASVWRILEGGYHAFDAVLPLILVASFPFVEWVVHVFVLHFKPVKVGSVTLDPLLAREHRAHHADPRDIPLVFIPTKTYIWLVPALVGVPLLSFDRLGLGLTFITATALIGLNYEWVHYLIHSDYKPRTKPYRAVWRNHRLHHYKNENYWFTVTTAGTSDRVLGTCPDPAEVETSPTAKDLLGTGA